MWLTPILGSGTGAKGSILALEVGVGKELREVNGPSLGRGGREVTGGRETTGVSEVTRVRKGVGVENDDLLVEDGVVTKEPGWLGEGEVIIVLVCV